MFNQLYQRTAAIRRHFNAPFLEERLRYLNHYAKQEARKSVLCQIAGYHLIIIKYLNLENGKVFTREDIKTAANQHTLDYKTRKGLSKENSLLSCKGRFIMHATRWLKFLDRIKINVSPLHSQITEFINYMQNEKGLSKSTIIQRKHHLKIFFSQNKEDLGQFLAHLTPRHIDELLIQISQKGIYNHCSIQSFSSSLRTFLDYSESRRWCPSGIADSIKTPRVYNHQTLPLGPSWETVQCLLKTTKGNRSVDIRDRAVLLLLAVYGLRDSEVRQLRLDDFDWDNEIFYIKRSKRGPKQQFPLVQTVGQALVRYIKKVRPQSSTHREVFLTMYSPCRPLVHLHNIVGQRWKLLDVAPIRHHGPHSLRHACATRLINQGISLKTIADQLGHRNLQTTGIYAKVDLSNLRKVANFKLGGLS